MEIKIYTSYTYMYIEIYIYIYTCICLGIVESKLANLIITVFGTAYGCINAFRAIYMVDKYAYEIIVKCYYEIQSVWTV